MGICLGVYTHTRIITALFKIPEVLEFPRTREKDAVIQPDCLCVLCRAAHHLLEKCLFTAYQVNCYIQGCKYQQTLTVIWQPRVEAGNDHKALP